MPIDTVELDAAIAGAIAPLRRLIDASGGAGGVALVERIDEVRRLPDGERRAMGAALLRPISTGWRGYDDASVGLQEIMDCFSASVHELRRIGVAALLSDDGAWLVRHADDAEVRAVLGEHHDVIPIALRHRWLLALPGKSEQDVGAHLLILDRGALVVVDGTHCYGPVKPDVLATVGQRISPSGPRPRYILHRDFMQRPLVVDLEQLRVTRLAREGVVRDNPQLLEIDDHGVVLSLGERGPGRRFTWDELEWSPLRAFEG